MQSLIYQRISFQNVASKERYLQKKAVLPQNPARRLFWYASSFAASFKV